MNMGAWQFMAVNLPEELPDGPDLAPGLAAGLGQPGDRLGDGTRAESSEELVAEAFAGSTAEQQHLRPTMYFTDRGIEELAERRGTETGHPRPGWPSAAASSTSIPTSRCRWSDWRPGSRVTMPTPTTWTADPSARLGP